MNLVKVVRILPCRVASFHVRDSLDPEQKAFDLYRVWADANGLSQKYRFLTLIGFNHPWGPVGKPRGYELLCPLDGLEKVNCDSVTVKEFPGGLFAVTTIGGLDWLMSAIERLHAWVKLHPAYELNYPVGYRHGIDPVPEFEIAYTQRPASPEEMVMDYCIPIREHA